MLFLWILFFTAVAILLMTMWIDSFSRKTHIKMVPMFHGTRLLMSRQLMAEGTQEFVEKNKTEGFVGMWFGPERAYFATDPDSAQFILNQRDGVTVAKKPLSNSELSRYVNESVVVTSGDIWKRHRQVYNPLFNSNMYKSYYEGTAEMVDKCVTKLEAEKGDIDFVPMMIAFAIDLLGKSMMDYDFGRMDGKNKDIYEAYKIVATLTPWRIVTIIIPFLETTSLPIARQLQWSKQVIEQVFTKIIDEKRTSKKVNLLTLLIAALKNHENGVTFNNTNGSNDNENNNHDNNKNGEEKANGSTSDEPQVKVQLTKIEVIANLFMLFIAGHETTAGSLSWAVLELAVRPDIQNKLYEEIQTLVGDKTPTFDDLAKFEYLERFICENFRLNPASVAVASRETLCDLTYKNQVIPKGAYVGVNFFNIHHHKDFWKDPFTFNPDRFLPENRKGIHKFAYIPFSQGPRMCIGNNFSLMGQRLFLIRLIQKFEIQKPSTHIIDRRYHAPGMEGPDSAWVSLKPRKR